TVLPRGPSPRAAAPSKAPSSDQQASASGIQISSPTAPPALGLSHPQSRCGSRSPVRTRQASVAPPATPAKVPATRPQGRSAPLPRRTTSQAPPSAPTQQVPRPTTSTNHLTNVSRNSTPAAPRAPSPPAHGPA